MNKYIFLTFICILVLTSCVSSDSTERKSENNDLVQVIKKNPDTLETDDSLEEYRQLEEEPRQYKKHTIKEKIDGKVYSYTFIVNDGKIKWTYKDPDEKSPVTVIYECNPDIPADAIIGECSGLAYWNLTSVALYDMTDELGMYSYDLHQKGKQMLTKCINNLSKARKYCPGAYKKAQDHYKNLIDAEGQGADALWEEICLMSFGLAEYPLDVCDIYDED